MTATRHGPRLAACLLAATAALPAGAQEWTRFRGPGGSGVATATGLPARWTAQTVTWKADLPAGGHASPVVWGNGTGAGKARVFATAADAEGNRFILCFDAADGRELWRRQLALAPLRQHRDNSLAASTPACDADGVYCLWPGAGKYLLTAFTHDGKPAWTYDLGGFSGDHGAGTSPVACGGLVIVANDQTGKSFAIAIDARTGAKRWQFDRKSGQTTYATACLLQPRGAAKLLVLANGPSGFAAVDIPTGLVKWELPGVLPHRCVASPAADGDMVVAVCGTGGRGTRLVAVKAPAAEGGKPQVALELTADLPYVPTPLVKDGRLYTWSDRGVVTCVDLAGGKTIWQGKTGAAFYGSPVWADGKLYCIARNGDVHVLAAGGNFEPLAVNPLGEKSFATPAVAAGRLLLRTWSKLFCVAGK